MTRERWCRNCRGWHRDGEWPRECGEALYGPRSERPNLPLPFIRRDNINALWHPADGREYTSRSEYDLVTKSKGLVEVGDADLSKEVKPYEDNTLKTDVIEAYKKVNEGYKPELSITADATTGWQEPTT